MGEEIEKTRMSVEYLMETYSKDQLMRLFKYQMINKVPVLGVVDVDMILALDHDDPQLTRPDREETADEIGQSNTCPNTE
jgi:hypothetical protein